MIRTIPDEARNEIIWHQERNAATVILSSALYPVCQAVAGHLNFDDIICTQLETVDDICTGKPVRQALLWKGKGYKAHGVL